MLVDTLGEIQNILLEGEGAPSSSWGTNPTYFLYFLENPLELKKFCSMVGGLTGGTRLDLPLICAQLLG